MSRGEVHRIRAVRSYARAVRVREDRSAQKILFLGRGVDTESLIQPTEAGRRVEPESERPSEGQQSGLALPFPECAYRYDGQQGGE